MSLFVEQTSMLCLPPVEHSSNRRGAPLFAMPAGQINHTVGFDQQRNPVSLLTGEHPGVGGVRR